MNIRNIRNCARCGENHGQLEAIELAQPMAPPECAPLQWTHYAMCPNGCGPIMFSNGVPVLDCEGPCSCAFASASLLDRYPDAFETLDSTEHMRARPWHHVDMYLTPADFVSHDVHEWIRTQLGPHCVSITIKAVHV